MAEVLTPMRRQILDFIVSCQRERNFPPTVREIGDHVGLKSPATVANHIEVLKRAGYLEKNPQQPRTLTVRYDIQNEPSTSNIRHLRLLGDVAAGTGVLAQEQDSELVAVPEQFADEVPGKGTIVVAGIPGEEATVKRYFPQGSRTILKPENDAMEPLDFATDEVTIYGRVISVLRSY